MVISHKLQDALDSNHYVGRFAPTPSGPLHFGSVIAALTSYLETHTNRGRWYLRFDDIDTPRVDPKAFDKICTALSILNMEWDGEPIYQSEHITDYQSQIESLEQAGMVYKCYCPRKLVKNRAYPGTCRSLPDREDGQYSLRIKVPDTPVTFCDLIQGEISEDIGAHSGDFIIVRSDKLFSYNLAAALDDAQGITHVIRGADLLDTTPKQIYLQKLLGLNTPVYGHFPVAINPQGTKLSKQTGAQDVLDIYTPSQALVKALQFLGQPVEENLSSASPQTVIQWAVENWSLQLIPKKHSITVYPSTS